MVFVKECAASVAPMRVEATKTLQEHDPPQVSSVIAQNISLQSTGPGFGATRVQLIFVDRTPTKPQAGLSHSGEG